MRSSVRLAAARIHSSGNLGWSLAALVIACLAAAPLVAVALIGMQSSGNTWPHLLSTVLPSSALTTLELMLGVGVMTLVTGAGTAWLVTMFRFPGRGLFEWALLVPLAMPTYIIAFSYLELFDYSGTVQSALRGVFGWQSAADYWFPDIRSTGGGVIVMSFVLYPYVYLTARASFLQQSVCALEVSRTLGRTAWGSFWSVALPLARPALVAGVTLALMETLNDIGAVEFLGIQTLTVSIYSTWLERSSLPGAAQISSIMLMIVFLLIYIERSVRRRQRFHHTTGKY
ncbi:MAG TPA: iron ABC transporter permease, partial [Rhizobiales bacterium]|nr:iron ABC transporter permease [Hyphomicrobiales bacterium]